MKPQREVSRREFLGTAAGMAGGVMLGRAALGAKKENDMAGCPQTEQFWYRRPPEGLFVDSQRGDRAFAWSEGKILLSEDNGHHWPQTAEFADASKILFSHIFAGGNVLFATLANLYLATDGLTKIRPVTVLGLDGNEYRPHKPTNPDLPGWYFHTLTGVSSWEIDGREMLVWGNYCNVLGGAAPVSIYYSTDGGETVKVAYTFGQNPYYSDNGRPGGGRDGQLLGNPDNPVICRHVHDVAYNPAEDAFYACTGDGTKPEGKECHWLRGTYDAAKDSWDWKVILSDESNTRYKSGGLNFVGGKLYWAADANGPKPHDRGIFCCDPADLTKPDRHTRLYQPGVESAIMIVQDGVILASHCGPASPMNTGFFFSPDLGKTWATYDLKEFGKRSPVRFHPKNGEGWFRVDLRSSWVTPAEMLFIKPKA